MSKIKNEVIDDLNKDESYLRKYLENLGGQIKILEAIVKEKDNLIKNLEDDIVRLNDGYAQIKTIIEKLYE